MTFCCCLGWRFERCARFEGCRVCLEIYLPDPCPAVTRASSLGIPSPEETSSAVASKGPVCCCQRKGLVKKHKILHKILHFSCNFSVKRKRDAALQNFCSPLFKNCFALLFNSDTMRAFIFWPDQNLNYTFNNWLIIYTCHGGRNFSSTTVSCWATPWATDWQASPDDPCTGPYHSRNFAKVCCWSTCCCGAETWKQIHVCTVCTFTFIVIFISPNGINTHY